MCLASRANGTPRARPDRVPSALSVMRSFGLAGATVMASVGRGDFGLRQQPSRQHGFGERHGDREAPRRAQHAQILRRGSAPEPPQSSGTHDSGRPASVSACHSGAFQPPFLIAVDGLGVGEIGKYPLRGLGDDILALRTQRLAVHRARILIRAGRRPSIGAVCFLHRMMRKSRCPDKRDVRMAHLRRDDMKRFASATA